MKNLFRPESSGRLECQLPTGYRHILLNVIFDDKLIVELQFNLQAIFAVLGDAGPLLHCAIRKLEDAQGDRDIGDKLLIKCIEADTDPAQLNEYLLETNTTLDKGLDSETAPEENDANSRNIPEGTLTDSDEEPVKLQPAAEIISETDKEPPDGDPNALDSPTALHVDNDRCHETDKQVPTSSDEPSKIQITTEDGPKTDKHYQEQVPTSSDESATIQITTEEGHEMDKHYPEQVATSSNEPTKIQITSGGGQGRDMESPKNDFAQAEPDSPLERALFNDAVTPKAGRSLREFSECDVAPLKSQEEILDEIAQEWGIVAPLIKSEDQLLEELAQGSQAFSLIDVWKSFVNHALKNLEGNPRDVSALHSLLSILAFTSKVDYQVQDESEHHLLSALGEPLSKDGILRFTEALLKRYLAIAYQDSSVSMIGWVATMENGDNARIGERPLQILHEIGACLAEQGRWVEAEDVYRTLVLRCERQLPLYHPVTIASMLDLATANSYCPVTNSRIDFGNKVIARASERVSSYLAEMEHSHTMHYQQSLTQSQSGLLMFEIDTGRKALSMLEAFAESFEGLTTRKLMTVIPPDHDVYLAQRCILADCLLVIANCWTLTELSVPERRSTRFWHSAFVHYRAVFRVSANAHALDDPRAASAAYGLARVLRGLGKVSEALNVLTPVVKALSHAHGSETDCTKQTFSFIPHPVTLIKEGVDQRMVAAQCQWLMAVLTADESPDDDGRSKALKCLHKASIALRHILDSSVQEDPRRKECVRLLHQIEEEARRIFHPLRRPTPTSSQHSRSDRRG